MNIKFVFNNELENYINSFLINSDLQVDIYVDRIDKNGIEIFNNVKSKDVNFYISISNISITKDNLLDICKISSANYYNNNITSETINNNIILGKLKDKIKILFVIPSFEYESILKSNNISIYIEGQTSDEEITNILKKLDNNKKSYIKLDKEKIQDLQDIKDLRNNKATTLSNLVSRDEVRKSFRKINEVEDEDAFLEMVRLSSQINYKGDDVIIDNNKYNTTFNTNMDIDNIEIDIGELND